MEGLGIRIPRDKKIQLFEKAELHYPEIRGLHNSIGFGRSSFNEHKKGELEVLGIGKTASLISIVNESNPVLKNEDVEDLKLGSSARSGDLIEIENDVQELVLRYFSIDELTDLFDRSQRSIENYRTGSSTYVPENGFSQALQMMKRELSSTLEFEAELVDLNRLGSHDEEVLARVNNEEIVEMYPRYRRLEDLIETRSYTRGALKQLENLDSLFEKPFPKPKNRGESVAYGILDRAGYLDRPGQKSAYRKMVDDDELYAISEYLSKAEEPEAQNQESYSTQDLVELVKSFYDEEGEVPTTNDLDNYESNYPEERKFSGGDEQFNSLLLRAGLPPNRERYGREELVDILAREYVENDFERFPEERINNSDIYPHAKTIERKMEKDFRSAMEEAGIPDLEDTHVWNAYYDPGTQIE
ncbi:MAG: hypothetical protein ACI8Z7_000336 [Candidatus Nanohaloarchaea archaeon]|jgi:hypothetical protein